MHAPTASGSSQLTGAGRTGELVLRATGGSRWRRAFGNWSCGFSRCRDAGGWRVAELIAWLVRGLLGLLAAVMWAELLLALYRGELRLRGGGRYRRDERPGEFWSMVTAC